jgi:hypothetical protein
MREDERPANAEEIERVKQTLGMTDKRWPVSFTISLGLIFGLTVTLIAVLSVWTAPVIARPSGALACTAGILSCYFVLALWAVAADLNRRNGRVR